MMSHDWRWKYFRHSLLVFAEYASFISDRFSLQERREKERL